MTKLPKISTLVMATHNPGKLGEFQTLLAPYIQNITSAGELGLPEPEETGTTFVENALLKARAAATLSNEVSLADDSGLCVNALGGDPGLYSARWALPSFRKDEFFQTTSSTEKKDFSLAMKRVNRDLGDNPDRSAYFICVLALVGPDGREEIIEGRINGQMVWPPRGDKGHGYDPVFMPDGYTQTFAEMDEAEKNKISHRGLAVRQFIERLSD